MNFPVLGGGGGRGRPVARLAPAPQGGATTGGYPWHDGELLYAADLNAAFATVAGYSIADFGAVSDGATDDSAALIAAITAVLALPTGGKVVLNAGKTVIASAISFTIPPGVTLTLEGMGIGASQLYFSNATDGLDFVLANSGSAWGSVHLAAFSLIRGPTSPAMANTGISISVQYGAMYNGNSSLHDLLVQGSATATQTNQWLNSVVLAGVSVATIDNVTINGKNATAADQGDVLLTLTGGPASSQYGVSFTMSNCILTGGSAGVNVSGWVQGVFVDNSSIIGQYDSIRWAGGGPYGAEELAVSNCTLNGAHRGFYVSGVNQCAVSNTTVLRFNVGTPPSGWAGMEFNQSAYNSIASNNVVGGFTGIETGILISAASTGPNAIVGNVTTNINGAGIWCEGNSTANAVVGNNLTGGTGIVQDTAGNTILANQWNGYQANFGSMFLTATTQGNQLVYQTGLLSRWFMGPDGSAESGGNAGSNFELVAAADNGTLLGAPMTINRANGLVTFQSYGAQDLNVALSGQKATHRSIQFQSTPSGGPAVTRWYVGADATAESGSNAGSNFEFLSYADNGTTPIGTPLAINRATGALTLTVPGNYTNDAAAATGGVPVGGVYRNGSVLQVRVT